jgi:hypothetical protein
MYMELKGEPWPSAILQAAIAAPSTGMSIIKDGSEIRFLDDWNRLAAPKKPEHWKQDRSAMEVARAWLEGGGVHLPSEVDEALAAHPVFGHVSSWDAEPEAKLRFDNYSGEPRNSDLIVYAQDSHGPFVVAVEAKADEPFGETVSEALAASLERYLENDRSKGVARVQGLAQALLGPRKPGDPPNQRPALPVACRLRGALCEAERRVYSRAVMLVHEFITDQTNDEYHSRNAADLGFFLCRLSHGEVAKVEVAQIHGPFDVPGAPLLAPGAQPPQLFIGKVSRNLRSRRA